MQKKEGGVDTNPQHVINEYQMRSNVIDKYQQKGRCEHQSTKKSSRKTKKRDGVSTNPRIAKKDTQKDFS